MAGGPRTSRWRRLAQRAAAPPPAPGERCELCSAPLDEEHRHLFDLHASVLCCACTACALLFDRPAAGGGHYRAVPRRRLRLGGFELDDLAWGALDVPVDLAFFVVDGAGAVTVTYPNPLGVVRSSPDPAMWKEVAEGHPALAGMEADVEGLVAYRRPARAQYWVVPVDDCYRLVSVVRAHWKGFTGGEAVWRHIDEFFDSLHRGSQTVDGYKEVQWSPG